MADDRGDNVIEATHLFRREPKPEEDSAFWAWGREWINDGILNLEYLVDEVKGATSEEDLLLALTDLRDEIAEYPIGTPG